MLRTLVAAGFALGFAFPALAQPANDVLIIQDGQGTAINQGVVHQQGAGATNTVVLNQLNALVNSGQITQDGYRNVVACIQSGQLLNTCLVGQLAR